MMSSPPRSTLATVEQLAHVTGGALPARVVAEVRQIVEDLVPRAAEIRGEIPPDWPPKFRRGPSLGELERRGLFF
jgi:hypothetical protein